MRGAMDEKTEELLSLYADETDVITACYEMMGKLLNRDRVTSRVKELEIRDLYIYGGGYLGIQLYRALERQAKVLSVVDKSGGLILGIPDIPVINSKQFQAKYRNEWVIITPIKHYRSIYDELIPFVPADKILFLGEFYGGKG